MNNNVPYFNAPSREAIVRRVTYIAGVDFDYDNFYANEKQTYYPFSAGARSPYGGTGRPPLSPPVLIPR